MAALDWSQCPAVESVPGKVSGGWVFKGTRLPVATVIENLEDRDQIVVHQIPSLDGETSLPRPYDMSPQRLGQKGDIK